MLAGGSGTALAAVTSYVALQGDGITLVERYGLLGLHAALVLFICRIGWEQLKIMRGIGLSMRSMAERQGDAKTEHKEILEEIRLLQRKK